MELAFSGDQFSQWLTQSTKTQYLCFISGAKSSPHDNPSRAVADQLYGDQEMHPCVRAQCMDYIQGNSDHYAQFVSEPIEIYVARKRALTVHGNHLEIQVMPFNKYIDLFHLFLLVQALSEMYGRPIHIYCYSQEPINIFQHIQNRPGVESELNIPIRSGPLIVVVR